MPCIFHKLLPFVILGTSRMIFLRYQPHNQCVLISFGLHPNHANRLPSPIFKSPVLFFKLSPFFLVSSEFSSSGVLLGGLCGEPVSAFSAILCTISSTSLILGLDLGCRARHLLAMAESFIADFAQQ